MSSPQCKQELVEGKVRRNMSINILSPKEENTPLWQTFILSCIRDLTEDTLTFQVQTQNMTRDIYCVSFIFHSTENNCVFTVNYMEMQRSACLYV